MKKTLLTLILLTMGLAGFSQNDSIKNKIINEIESTRVFEKSKHEKYCINTYRNTGIGCITKDYDTNGDREIDFSANYRIIDTKMINGKEEVTTKKRAELVMVGKDEKTTGSPKYKFLYADDDGDPDVILETKEYVY